MTRRTRYTPTQTDRQTDRETLYLMTLNTGGVLIGPDHPCRGQSEQVPYALSQSATKYFENNLPISWLKYGNYFQSIPTCVLSIPN